MRAATEPDTAGFRSQNGTVQIPLSSREFEASSYNLFAGAFNDTTSDQVACGTELSIAHALDIIAEIGHGLFCQVGFFG